MLDFGYHDKLPFSCLQPLREQLQEGNAYCICCHLVGIQPAGDVSKWSQTAVEYFQNLVRKEECFLKRSVSETFSLACDLVLHHLHVHVINVDGCRFLQWHGLLSCCGHCSSRLSLATPFLLPLLPLLPIFRLDTFFSFLANIYIAGLIGKCGRFVQKWGQSNKLKHDLNSLLWKGEILNGC